MTSASPSHRSRPGWIRRIVLPVIIIVLGVAAARYLYDTRPKAKRGRPPLQPPFVEVQTVEKGTYPVHLNTMGTVIPARQTALKARVSGFVETHSDKLMPGGRFKEGEIMIRLEQADFKLALDRKKAALARLSADLELEMGRQEVALEEIKILQDSSTHTIEKTDLALRKPQLARIRADMRMARADIDLAALDLKRTLIRAPFNCLILSETVEKGALVSAQSTVAQLAGTDRFRIQVSVPVTDLKWITLPDAPGKIGSAAVVIQQDGVRRTGRVTRLLGEMGSDTRLAALLISVDAPLDTAEDTPTPLLINSYVSVRIQGRSLVDAVALPRRLVRDQDRVWCLKGDRLEIRSLFIPWRDENTVYVTRGLEDGDTVIISDLGAPVAGMVLRTPGDPKSRQRPKGQPRESTPAPAAMNPGEQP